MQKVGRIRPRWIIACLPLCPRNNQHMWPDLRKGSACRHAVIYANSKESRFGWTVSICLAEKRKFFAYWFGMVHNFKRSYHGNAVEYGNRFGIVEIRKQCRIHIYRKQKMSKKCLRVPFVRSGHNCNFVIEEQLFVLATIGSLRVNFWVVNRVRL